MNLLSVVSRSERETSFWRLPVIRSIGPNSSFGSLSDYRHHYPGSPELEVQPTKTRESGHWPGKSPTNCLRPLIGSAYFEEK